ncbi:ATP-binding protein [Vagococcus lutrae]|uniref:ATP-binding protein n=1 Tax=Vagococcus lutrae TaxID=81947 RepID=UPI00200E7FDA|nr:ATP-binding protein [Vagococcus lutrae]
MNFVNINNLEDIIFSLIETRREDDYWEFKQCHHRNKADLLHDIICMANNRSNNNGYIIFGIQDKIFEIIGVENNKYRRNQQNIIDVLKSKLFL